MKTSAALLALHVFAGVAIVGFTACSKKGTPVHEEHEGHEHGHHAHAAPHGGTLVEIGDHQFNLELVRDAAAGTLTAYVLDTHAENFVRIPLPGFQLIATVDGQPRPLAFVAVSNAVTGETIGNTSEFSTQAEWLKTTARFDAVIPFLDVRGAMFPDVKFGFPEGSSD